MQSDWKKVYSGTDTFKAQLIKEKLDSSSIPCVLLNQKDSAYVMIGEVSVYVHESNFLKAVNIIEDSAVE